MGSKNIRTSLVYDWRQPPTLEDLKRALAPHKIFVYENPRYEGTDNDGYVFSSKELSEEEIQVLAGLEEL